MSKTCLASLSIAGHDTPGWSRLPAIVLAHIKAIIARKPSSGPIEEIGDIIAMNGGVLTDDLERRISRRLIR
jgi:hypothetical protein